MRGYSIYQDCADVTGNYTPNITTDCVQSGLSKKDERMQPQFWEHLKMALTWNMIAFKVVSLDNVFWLGKYLRALSFQKMQTILQIISLLLA